MKLRVVGVNVNGLRSAARKGFVEWAVRQDADLIGVQEIRIREHELQAQGLDRLHDHLPGWFHPADRPGYSGVGLYSRHEPTEVIHGIGDPAFDAEGRWVELRFDRPGRPLSVISAYFPSGTSGPERQAQKMRFLGLMTGHLAELRRQREFILVGDVNIAHREIDLANWRTNQRTPGFLPEERDWLTRLFDPREGGLVDVFRRLDDQPGRYTWWSQRSGARQRNVGWRIDYHLATPALAACARAATIHAADVFSDHAALTIDYATAL